MVVGIVALSAIAGGIFFFLRNRRRRAVEEEYRRNISGDYSAKPPTSSVGSLSDARLEPSVMMQRRQSDGSIADNQDYSRRILKLCTLFFCVMYDVTNIVTGYELIVFDIAGWSYYHDNDFRPFPALCQFSISHGFSSAYLFSHNWSVQSGVTAYKVM